MKREDVINRIKIQRAKLLNRKTKKENLEIEIKKLNKESDLIWDKIYKIQSVCKHSYIGKPNGVMGRGKCDYCGSSDY